MRAIFSLHDIDDTVRLGTLLAEHLPSGTVTALLGTLGAGKTRLVQAIAEACGIEPSEVMSPTFVLCREYHGRRSIAHFDAYRLRDEDEFQELGPEEYFSNSDLTFIEWADRVSGCLPRDHVQLELEIAGETSRQVTLQAFGTRFEPAVEKVVREFARS